MPVNLNTPPATMVNTGIMPPGSPMPQRPQYQMAGSIDPMRARGEAMRAAQAPVGGRRIR